MSIPLVDLQRQCATLREDVLSAVDNIIQKANFILGEEVEIFEEEFAESVIVCRTRKS